MLPTWITHPWHGLTRVGTALARATQCRICHAWQDRPLCLACTQAWRPAQRRCSRCAIALRDTHADKVCQHCEDQSPEFDRAVTAVDYEGPWPALLTGLKFRQHTALARPLAQLLADAVGERRGACQLVMPVPLSAQRRRERGYNQAWLIAREVARLLRMPSTPDGLERCHHTPRLMALSAEARAQQIDAAFDVPRHQTARLRGLHVALVDDVMTTGATLNACARALQAVGVRSVSAWVVARTPTPNQRDLNGGA